MKGWHEIVFPLIGGGILLAVIITIGYHLLTGTKAPSAAPANTPSSVTSTTTKTTSHTTTMSQDTHTTNSQPEDLLTKFKNVNAQIGVLTQKESLTPIEQSQLDTLQNESHALRDQLKALDTTSVSATLQASTYGYTVSVLVNGKDIGVTGGGSSAVRLFSPDSFMCAAMQPDMASRLCVLKQGANDVTVTYHKGPAAAPMTLKLFAYDPPVTLLEGSFGFKSENTVHGTVTLEHSKPSGAQTLTLTD